MKKSTWLHLRIPFSFFLLPVFLFALAIEPGVTVRLSWAMLAILHFFLYPASNGFNSYFDKDQQSIGGLEHPPPVSKQLYYVSLGLDGIAILWGLMLRWEVALMLFIYGMISKAYSHPWIRLKKYPIIGWLAAGVFQGAFTFMMVFLGVHGVGFSKLAATEVALPALLSTLLLWGSYPMTQIYQHAEDARRGDLTLSRLLGIRGTFLFTAVVFLIADAGFVYYFWQYQHVQLAFLVSNSFGAHIGIFHPVDDEGLERQNQGRFSTHHAS